jgi:hypothetical protein
MRKKKNDRGKMTKRKGKEEKTGVKGQNLEDREEHWQKGRD